jgi:hypothetical protein
MAIWPKIVCSSSSSLFFPGILYHLLIFLSVLAFAKTYIYKYM